MLCSSIIKVAAAHASLKSEDPKLITWYLCVCDACYIRDLKDGVREISSIVGQSAERLAEEYNVQLSELEDSADEMSVVGEASAGEPDLEQAAGESDMEQEEQDPEALRYALLDEEVSPSLAPRCGHMFPLQPTRPAVCARTTLQYAIPPT